MAATETVVLASGNPGKLRELRHLLAGLPITLVARAALGAGAALETGSTFRENAEIKARHVARLTGLPAIADDSGLEVDALDGAPGIHSARFAGAGASAAANVERLLERLAHVPWPRRTARFQCVLVFLAGAGECAPLVCRGTWNGRILTHPAGDNGFGYDPVFFVPECGASAAELAPDVKSRLSHRGQAVRQLRAMLEQRYRHDPSNADAILMASRAISKTD